MEKSTPSSSTSSSSETEGLWGSLSRFLAGGESKSSLGLLLVHQSIFVYSLAFWIQRPVLSYLSKELGGDAVDFGTLESVLSVLSLLGGPMMGRLTDERGARATIIASHFGSLVMYLLMGTATSYAMLALSRVPAFLQHCMLCSQAAISQLTFDQNRSAAMGRLSLSYAAGMVIGSYLGGEIGTNLGFQCAALVAAALTAISIAITLAFMPAYKRSGSSPEKESSKNVGPSAAIDQVKEFLRLAMVPRIRNLLLLLFPISVGIGSFRSMLPLAGEEVFGLQPSSMGRYISFAAFVGLGTNVLVIAPATRYLGEAHAVAAAAAIQMACYAFVPAISTYESLLVLTVPMTISSTLLYTLSSSLMSLAVDQGSAGSAIAMSHGLRSFVGIVSPLIGGFLYEQRGFSGIAHAAAILAAVTLVFSQTTSKASLLDLVQRKEESSKRD
ncbi:Solute carrier family 22 member 18 [Hondaea fermentalgiana]|uniref:Solute carrier family 22 member 18 n=1 Tax=Hondaea fermentalgiana TaxID=2315210 RepID=A0A2R5GMH4_9STRA|nr:Solute carrier family 22 member 18 [Hondaea fermentalgiana]|eukprot:GBG32087.1 Solute carrier family 22 member 18 [Hondaea fermentalgiana]